MKAFPEGYQPRLNIIQTQVAIKKIKDFFKGVRREGKSVRWPSGKDLANYSFITIVMLVFFGLFFYGLDALFALIRGLF